MNKLENYLNKNLEGKDRNKWSSFNNNPLMDAIFNIGHVSLFMQSTEKFSLRIEAEQVEEKNNSWLTGDKK